MKTKPIVLAAILLAGLAASSFGGDLSEYQKAKRSAKRGQYDFAYMHYSSLLRQYPQSKYREKTIFALGEYFYLIRDYATSQQYFTQYLEEYPDSDELVYALLYLYQIAERQKKEGVADKLKTDIIKLKQVSLVFRKYKDYKFKSPLARLHRVVFEIDQISLYVDGELFVQISY